jgi:hypothetical protein
MHDERLKSRSRTRVWRRASEPRTRAQGFAPSINQGTPFGAVASCCMYSMYSEVQTRRSSPSHETLPSPQQGGNELKKKESAHSKRHSYPHPTHICVQFIIYNQSHISTMLPSHTRPSASSPLSTLSHYSHYSHPSNHTHTRRLSDSSSSAAV